MASRAAVLIHCSKAEARTIREQARRERRTISGYLVNLLMRAIKLDENFARLRKLGVTEVPYVHLLEYYGLNALPSGKVPGPRTSILFWCAKQEAKRIRTAAGRREITITGFIMHTLRSTWTAGAEQNATLRHALWLAGPSERANVAGAARSGRALRKPQAN